MTGMTGAPLPAEAAAAWADWCRAERNKRARADRDAAEARFMALAEALSPEDRDAFAVWWVRAHLGEIEPGAPVPFRLPLVGRIVAPVLAAGRRTRQPGFARWTARLRDSLVKARELGHSDLPVPAFEDLLQSALAADPGDDAARRIWLNTVLGGLDYALHELPALLAPPEDIELDARRAEELAAELGEGPRFADRIAAIREVLESGCDPEAIARYWASPDPRMMR